MGDKKILHIEIKRRRSFKNNIIRWCYWHIYFQFWHIWRLKFLSKFYWLLSELFFLFTPRSKRIELREEFNRIDTIVIEDNINEAIKETINNNKIEI